MTGNTPTDFLHRNLRYVLKSFQANPARTYPLTSTPHIPVPIPDLRTQQQCNSFDVPRHHDRDKVDGLSVKWRFGQGSAQVIDIALLHAKRFADLAPRLTRLLHVRTQQRSACCLIYAIPPYSQHAFKPQNTGTQRNFKEDSPRKQGRICCGTVEVELPAVTPSTPSTQANVSETPLPWYSARARR